MSSIELINETSRPVYVRSKGVSLGDAREWSGTIGARERETIWVGRLPLESLSIEVDGKRHDYPPLPLPSQLGPDSEGQRDAWWRWKPDGPTLTVAGLNHFQEMVRSYVIGIFVILMGIVVVYRAVRQEYIRRRS